MKKLLGPACFAALLALFAAGCATTEVEEPIPVDITLEELQSKMTRAMDPTGRYAKAKTYTMQQTTSTERFLDDPEVQRVEVKFARPDSFSLTTYEDNEPLSGVNITLGLPIIRTSVDHGTAFDIAGKGIASETSLIEAIEYAEKLGAARI